VLRNGVILAICLAIPAPTPSGPAPIPDWCRALPRPEFKALERIPAADPWFEVYKPARDVFAIYEPHQAEEVISYLIVGEERALLFDTGMGISDLRKTTAELTKLPIMVLNSHTHDDHVGDNWEFDTVYGMDTDFTRQNAKGSRGDAQAEITPDQICGALPKGFDSIAPTACSSPATLTIPRPSGSSAPRPISMRMPRPSAASPLLRHSSSWFWARTIFPSPRLQSCFDW
jgi:hypothetical protein